MGFRTKIVQTERHELALMPEVQPILCNDSANRSNRFYANCRGAAYLMHRKCKPKQSNSFELPKCSLFVAKVHIFFVMTAFRETINKEGKKTDSVTQAIAKNVETDLYDAGSHL